jgi:hypothetical protein
MHVHRGLTGLALLQIQNNAPFELSSPPIGQMDQQQQLVDCDPTSTFFLKKKNGERNKHDSVAEQQNAVKFSLICLSILHWLIKAPLVTRQILRN